MNHELIIITVAAFSNKWITAEETMPCKDRVILANDIVVSKQQTEEKRYDGHPKTKSQYGLHQRGLSAKANIKQQTEEKRYDGHPKTKSQYGLHQRGLSAKANICI
ncbi:hypothetical protein QE152_g25367 [Popillia japonica]|uniref:Uncharacterized protein n=1 Tax=Popillia japonica TaxID=7064 RepID=A0AAW1K0P2_POPJA